MLLTGIARWNGGSFILQYSSNDFIIWLFIAANLIGHSYNNRWVHAKTFFIDSCVLSVHNYSKSFYDFVTRKDSTQCMYVLKCSCHLQWWWARGRRQGCSFLSLLVCFGPIGHSIAPLHTKHVYGVNFLAYHSTISEGFSLTIFFSHLRSFRKTKPFREGLGC